MKNKGISLITLVITIIIMIILAGAIILTLTNSGIFDKANDAVSKYNDKQQQILDDLIWAENYPDDKTPGEDEEPSKWVSEYTEDGVPIPVGFVASPYDGTDGMPAENTKAGGLVIYELKEGETSATDIREADKAEYTELKDIHYNSMETRNQFVWVPVDKNNFATEFVRDDFGQTVWEYDDEIGEDVEVMLEFSKKLGIGYWELVLDANNMPSTTQDTDYVSAVTLQEATAMYESVKEYGGFYIARYEAGTDEVDEYGYAIGNISITMGKYPYNYVKWSDTEEMIEVANDGQAVALSRAFYPNNSTNTTGVVSTLTYGVQWDTTLNWWTGKDLTDSTSYGNYYNTSIEEGDYNENAQYSDDYGSSWKDAVAKEYDEENDEGQYWLLTTGAFKNASVNNIYDMAGNLFEWTMEGSSTYLRVSRGGDFISYGGNIPVINRNHYYPYDEGYHIGFRPSLYIK